MTARGVIIISFIFVCLLNADCLANPCSNASVLPSLFKRNVGYTVKPGEARLCDNYLADGWYTISSSYAVATSNKACGTWFTWYINGSLPQKGGANMTLCMDNKAGNTCALSNPIQVKYCGTKTGYVFYLTATDGCPEGYCIEDISGTTQPGPPVLSVSLTPVINAEVQRPNKRNELYFYCDFSPDSNTQYFYTVAWYLSNGASTSRHIWSSDPVRYVTKSDFRGKTALSESLLRSKSITKLGFHLACKVEASHKRGSLPGAAKSSVSKFIGIEILNKTTVHLKNTQVAFVYIKLTVPFGCSNNDPTCHIYVNVFMPNTDNCDSNDIALRKSLKNGCGLKISNKEVDVPKKLEFTGKYVKKIQPQGRHLVARLATLKRYNAHPLFQAYILEPIMIRLETKDAKLLSGKKCHSVNDPHILTFDGTYFNNHNSGTFTLYENAKYRTQVQIQTTKCPNYDQSSHRPWCNCGAAVAVGKDVFVMSNCNHGWDIGLRNCGNGVLINKVFQRGKLYRVQLPTGGEVRISVNPGWTHLINVEIIPSVYDYGETIGLCGLFDGNKSNDQKPRAGASNKHPILSWSVSENKSLFKHQTYNSLTSWDEKEYLCTCELKPDIFGPTPKVNCSAEKVKVCPYQMYSQAQTPCPFERVKRHTRDASFIDLYDIHSSIETAFANGMDNEDYAYQGRRKRSRSYDTVTARRECLHALNTTVFQLCETVPDLDVEPYITSCVDDAMATNSMEWALAHLEGVKSHCTYQVEINQPLPPDVTLAAGFIDVMNDTNVNSTDRNSSVPIKHAVFEAFSPEFLAKVEALSCMNECSGNGVCTNGTCKCNDGFTDPDCSIELSKPPVMRGIPDKGLCDLTKRLCRKTSVMGDNFAESNELMCKITGFDVNATSSVVSLTSMKRPATRISFAEVSCQLPDFNKRVKRSDQPLQGNSYIARGYNISISNDGVNFGSADSVVIFDSTCVNCTKIGANIICTKNPGFCMRDGRCFARGELSGCEICGSPGDRKGNWYKGPDCPISPAPDMESPKLWIIGAVLGAAVALIGFVTILYICNRKGKKTVEKDFD